MSDAESGPQSVPPGEAPQFNPIDTFRDFTTSLGQIKDAKGRIPPIGQRRFEAYLSSGARVYLEDEMTSAHSSWPAGVRRGEDITDPTMLGLLEKEGNVTMKVYRPGSEIVDAEYWMFGNPEAYKNSIPGYALKKTAHIDTELPKGPTIYYANGFNDITLVDELHTQAAEVMEALRVLKEAI